MNYKEKIEILPANFTGSYLLHIYMPSLGSETLMTKSADVAEVLVHVRRNIKLAEAPSYGKTIFEYEPKCHGAADYQTVAEYIHSQTGSDFKGDISKQPPIPIQELGPVKKAATTLGDDMVETSQTDTNLSTTSG
jgi:hypothetical protein